MFGELLVGITVEEVRMMIHWYEQNKFNHLSS